MWCCLCAFLQAATAEIKLTWAADFLAAAELKKQVQPKQAEEAAEALQSNGVFAIEAESSPEAHVGSEATCAAETEAAAVGETAAAAGTGDVTAAAAIGETAAAGSGDVTAAAATIAADAAQSEAEVCLETAVVPELVTAAAAVAAATAAMDATTVSSVAEVSLETGDTPEVLVAAIAAASGSTTEIAAPSAMPAAEHGDAVKTGSFGCFAFLQQSKNSKGGKKVKAAGAMWASAGKLLDPFKLLPVTKVVAEEQFASVSFVDRCSKLKRNMTNKMTGIFKKGHKDMVAQANGEPV